MRQGFINNWLKLWGCYVMDASQLLGTIIRILNQPVFPPRAKPVHGGKTRPALGRPHLAAAGPAVPAVRADAARPSVPTGPAPITVTPVSAPAPLSAASPLAAAGTPAPATTQAMRTLEEVRADLARLRDQAKRRQAANAQARRERAFAPTDFMEYGQPAAPVETSAPARAFAPTDFLDFGTGKPS